MQARPIRRGPSSSSLSADPQGGRQAPLTAQCCGIDVRTNADDSWAERDLDPGYDGTWVTA